MLQYNYGISLLRQSDSLEPEEAAKTLDESIEHFKRATEIQSSHERAWNGWGQALLLRGRVADAMEKFDRSIAINESGGTLNIDPLMGRARALYEARRFAESKSAFETALAAAVKLRGSGAVERIEVATIYQYLGRIAAEQGDLDAAGREYAEAVRIVGDSSVIRYEYGQLLARVAKREMGIATTQPTTMAATRVAATTPAMAQATTRAATPSTTQPTGRARELLAAAAAQLAAAIELRPDYIDARIALANLMIDVGNLTGARTQLTAAVRSLSTVSTNAVYPPLEDAVKRWDAEFRKREASATQPATMSTTTTTRPSTGITSEIISGATTQPSTR
jgi:tetratricopeptide (TPR) repeat protein